MAKHVGARIEWTDGMPPADYFQLCYGWGVAYLYDESVRQNLSESEIRGLALGLRDMIAINHFDGDRATVADGLNRCWRRIDELSYDLKPGTEDYLDELEAYYGHRVGRLPRRFVSFLTDIACREE